MPGGPHRKRDAPSPSTAGAEEELDPALALDRLRGEERRAAIGRVVSTLSHALGTPLNVISGRAAMMGMRDLSPEQLVDNARIIGEQVRSITGILNRVLAYSREGWPGPVPTALSALTRSLVTLLRPIAQARDIRLELGEVHEIAARVHGPRIEQVLVNLLTFGMTAVERGGRVSLSLVEAELEPPGRERGRAVAGPCARFDVRLHGVALPEPDYEHVYGPWLGPEAGTPEERALAMLYAVAFGIAREHRAWVELHVEPGTASTFSLCWPLGGGV